MKKICITISLILLINGLRAQRVITEGTIFYTLEVDGSSGQEAASIFNGATYTVYLKGTQALQ